MLANFNLLAAEARGDISATCLRAIWGHYSVATDTNKVFLVVHAGFGAKALTQRGSRFERDGRALSCTAMYQSVACAVGGYGLPTTPSRTFVPSPALEQPQEQPTPMPFVHPGVAASACAAPVPVAPVPVPPATMYMRGANVGVSSDGLSPCRRRNPFGESRAQVAAAVCSPGASSHPFGSGLGRGGARRRCDRKSPFGTEPAMQSELLLWAVLTACMPPTETTWTLLSGKQAKQRRPPHGAPEAKRTDGDDDVAMEAQDPCTVCRGTRATVPCAFCERGACEFCNYICEGCSEVFCSFCSTIKCVQRVMWLGSCMC